MNAPVYIASAKRTPIGAFQGALSNLTAAELGAHAIRAAATAAAAEEGTIDEVIMGNVISAGAKQAPARQAARGAGLPDHVPATTVNKVCGSGMKAVMIANDLIRAGSAGRVLAGGMESMSNAPYLLRKARRGIRLGHDQLLDAMFVDGLEDADSGGAMGTFAQRTANEHQISREAMDAFAVRSVQRAQAAIAAGSLSREIAPIEVRGEPLADDEQPGRARIDRIPQLRPAFSADGTITAANSSSISDGAAALIVANQAGLYGAEPLARIVGHATHAQHPSTFTTAPAGAMRKLAEKIGWALDEVDLFEINEAFAMVTMLAINTLDLDPERVNIYGGACAQGHPIGATGARLIVTLAHALNARGARRGIASLCIGGGEATAIALETP